MSNNKDKIKANINNKGNKHIDEYTLKDKTLLSMMNVLIVLLS